MREGIERVVNQAVDKGERLSGCAGWRCRERCQPTGAWSTWPAPEDGCRGPVWWREVKVSEPSNQFFFASSRSASLALCFNIHTAGIRQEEKKIRLESLWSVIG